MIEIPWLPISIIIAGCLIAYSIALRGFNIASLRRSEAEKSLDMTYTRWVFRLLLHRVRSFIWILFHWRQNKRMKEYFKFLEDVGKITVPADWRT